MRGRGCVLACVGLLVGAVACGREPLPEQSPGGEGDQQMGQVALTLQGVAIGGVASVRVRMIDPDDGDPCQFARPFADARH
jgi:hypothetical protein